MEQPVIESFRLMLMFLLRFVLNFNNFVSTINAAPYPLFMPFSWQRCHYTLYFALTFSLINVPVALLHYRALHCLHLHWG
jgi:Na+-transporting NADH:ubiquinone oxidoreductase subunit NqrB